MQSIDTARLENESRQWVVEGRENKTEEGSAERCPHTDTHMPSTVPMYMMESCVHLSEYRLLTAEQKRWQHVSL